jgi:hypothetical protein
LSTSLPSDPRKLFASHCKNQALSASFSAPAGRIFSEKLPAQDDAVKSKHHTTNQGREIRFISRQGRKIRTKQKKECGDMAYS